MTIKDWLAEDRPREKLLQRGSAALTDAELLAISDRFQEILRAFRQPAEQSFELWPFA